MSSFAIYTVSAVLPPMDGVDVKAFANEADALAFVEECVEWEKGTPKRWREFSRANPDGDRHRRWVGQMPYGAAVSTSRLDAFCLVITPIRYASVDEAAIELAEFNATAQAAHVAALNKIK